MKGVQVDIITIEFTWLRKVPISRHLFLISKSATVFLVDIIDLGKAYVHKIFMNFVDPNRDRMKIAQNL